MSERSDATREARKPLTTHDVLRCMESGERMGIWGWAHATRSLEEFVPEDGPVRDLWSAMARTGSDVCRNDVIGLIDYIRRAEIDALRARLADTEAALAKAAKALDACKCDNPMAHDGDDLYGLPSTTMPCLRCAALSDPLVRAAGEHTPSGVIAAALKEVK